METVGMETQTGGAALTAARVVVKVLLVLNVVLAVLCALVVVGSFAAQAEVLRVLGEQPDIADPRNLLNALRIVMVIGLAAAPLAHMIFARLLAMIDTVRAGDPFVAVNARRLTTIAWALLGLQILDLGFGFVSAALVPDANEFAWNPSISGWLAVLMLFVLARVFHHGARMRDDLEGTV